MKLEQQVCNMQQGKRLAELGITKFTGIFRWCVFCPDPTGEKYFYDAVYGDGTENDMPGEYICDAYTVAELGAMFGIFLDANLHNADKDFDTWFEGMKAKYGDHLSVCYNPLFTADYLIYLLENGILTAEQCNSALQKPTP